MLRKKGKMNVSSQLVVSATKWVMAKRSSGFRGNDKYANKQL